MTRFYLDENATTALDPRVRTAMEPYLSGPAGNASSIHAEGRRARAAIDEARDSMAALLKAKPSEIIFTGGGTESCNLAVLGLARAHAARGRHVITARTEHHAVLRSFQALAREGFEVTWLEVDRDGLIDPADLSRALRSETTLVSIMSANNETGVRQPMRALGEICASRGVLFHTDAIQSAGKEPLARESWQVSALSLAAHKFGGPLGAGLLWLRTGVPLARLMEGGAQENERRPGTENVAAIAGLASAGRLHLPVDEVEAQRQSAWIERLWDDLARLGNVRRNGHPAQRISNTLNVTFEDLHPEELLIGLDLAGLAVSSGSACLVGSVQPSHVLSAMGLSAHGATVRISIGAGISDEALPEIVHRIGKVVRQQRAAHQSPLEAAA